MELERHGIVVQPGGTVPFLPLTFQAGSGGGLRSRSGHSSLRGSVEPFMSAGFLLLFVRPFRSPEPHSAAAPIRAAAISPRQL